MRDNRTNRAGRRYTISMWGNRARSGCPVPGCPATITSRWGMRRHFAYMHWDDDVCIQEEGVLPKCPHCGLRGNHSPQHATTVACRKAADQRRKREIERVQNLAAEVTFTINGMAIESVASFCYLGRVLTHNDDDWMAMAANIGKARGQWRKIAKLLRTEGMSPKVMASFYKSVVMSVLLYGAETWTLTKANVKALAGFHYEALRGISGLKPVPAADDPDTLIWPSTADVLERTGSLPITEYLARRKATIRLYISNRPILAACRASRASQTDPNQIVWWSDWTEAAADDGGDRLDAEADAA